MRDPDPDVQRQELDDLGAESDDDPRWPRARVVYLARAAARKRRQDEAGLMPLWTETETTQETDR